MDSRSNGHYQSFFLISDFLAESPSSEFSSYEFELRNRVTQNDVTLRITNSKMFTEILFSSY